MPAPLTIPLLLLVLILSLTLKTLRADLPDESKTRDHQRRQLTEHLSTAGLTAVGSQRLTPDGEFELLEFKTDKCQGALYVLPLYRNAEGQHVLSARLTHLPETQGFVYRGQRYYEFPSLRFWLFEQGDRLLGQDGANPVLHFFEYGSCGIAAHLDTLGH